MRIMLLLCLLGLAPCGCKKRPPATPVSNQPAAPPNPSTDLPKLVEAVRSHVMSQGKPPETLDDLVKNGCIGQLPTPPPGKKYVLDAKKTGVVLVNE